MLYAWIGFRQIKDVYEHLVIDEKTAPLAMSRAAREEDEQQILRRMRVLHMNQ